MEAVNRAAHGSTVPEREDLPMSNSIDRAEVSRSLAKAIAYKNCGKDAEAEQWAWKLVEQLGCAGILRQDIVRRGNKE